ncbi:unnamed protein product, partial [Brenthis ino]
MFSWPIPATAANLIETSQLRRRYYIAQVYAQTQRALSIPVTLILRWDDTRRDRHAEASSLRLRLRGCCQAEIGLYLNGIEKVLHI